MRFKVYLLTSHGRQHSAASLRPVGAPAGEPSIPDLYEPALLAISSLALRLRGYERLEERDGPRAVLQEWHCELP